MFELRQLDRSAWLFYARAHFEGTQVGWGDEPPDQETLAIVGHGPGRLLDSGCGSGRHTIALAQRGFSVVGIDIFGRPLERARRRALEAGVAVTFVRTAATAVDDHFGGPFDVVLDVLGPASDLGRAFHHRYASVVRRLLAPGGRFIVRTFLGRDELAALVDPFVFVEERATLGGRWIVMA